MYKNTNNALQLTPKSDVPLGTLLLGATECRRYIFEKKPPRIRGLSKGDDALIHPSRPGCLGGGRKVTRAFG